MNKLRMIIAKINQHISGILACIIGCFIYPQVARETDKMMSLIISPSASGKEETE